jgi:hypothetical protein
LTDCATSSPPASVCLEEASAKQRVVDARHIRYAHVESSLHRGMHAGSVCGKRVCMRLVHGAVSFCLLRVVSEVALAVGPPGARLTSWCPSWVLGQRVCAG